MIASVAIPTTTWYLVLAAVLFGIGTVGVLVRRNPLIILMCVELMLNAVNLTFVALAKKLEEVFVPGQSEPIVLPDHAPGLQLLQRIRDEAHRFAVTFHRQRRDHETDQ